jgi:ATP-dependent phosphofructokinase / diphosphate-dependent phosphofructokinase
MSRISPQRGECGYDLPMKRIAILTAGGDTPALNATISGAVTRANQHRVEVVGIIKGFSGLLNARVPHVVLNPLYTSIPELNPTMGGTLLGASRDYVDANDAPAVAAVIDRLGRLRVEGLVCVGGDGTLNGMQALGDSLPAVLAPKTIDNDLGLNYRSEPDEWVRRPEPDGDYSYSRRPPIDTIDLGQMVNYVTPGYTTSVYVSAAGVERIRTTAESHRRIAIIEVMGRHSGYIALGACYGRPDILLVPEHPLDPDALVERIKEIYDLQKNVVIICGEGIVDREGQEFGAELTSTDPAGNKLLSGASEALRSLLIARLGDSYFTSRRRNESARVAIFTRKVGHTQRGGRPIRFDRFYAAQLGGNAVDMLLAGQVNAVSVLQWSPERGFHVDGVPANDFRDRWGLIHARQMHPSFYDPRRMRPSAVGVEYLQTIFDNALGADDTHALGTVFAPGHLTAPYHSVNTDVGKRIRYLAD